MAESKNKSNQTVNDDFTHWQLPDVTVDPYDSGSDAFGHQGNAVSDTAASDNLMPPTMAELEQIRIAAEQEGYEEGHTCGYKEGLAQGNKDGFEQGHQQGFEQGHKQGHEESIASVKQVVERLEGIIGQFQHPLTILDKEIELELMELTIALSKSVIGHEIQTHPEHILITLQQGIAALPMKTQQVSIQLHPDDADLVREAYSQVQLEKNAWDIIEDPDLSVGDCILQTQNSAVDLRLQQRLSAALESTVQRQTQLMQEAAQRNDDKPKTSTMDAIADEYPTEELTVVDDETDKTNPNELTVQTQGSTESDRSDIDEQGTQNVDQTKPTAE